MKSKGTFYIDRSYVVEWTIFCLTVVYSYFFFPNTPSDVHQLTFVKLFRIMGPWHRKNLCYPRFPKVPKKNEGAKIPIFLIMAQNHSMLSPIISEWKQLGKYKINPVHSQSLSYINYHQVWSGSDGELLRLKRQKTWMCPKTTNWQVHVCCYIFTVNILVINCHTQLVNTNRFLLGRHGNTISVLKHTATILQQ